MQRYKSIFSESTIHVVPEGLETKVININHLNWHPETFENLTYYEAVKKAPRGYRLPTIQELYSAFVYRVPGFIADSDHSYISSSSYSPKQGDLAGSNYSDISFEDNSEYFWFMDFTRHSSPLTVSKSQRGGCARYVR